MLRNISRRRLRANPVDALATEMPESVPNSSDNIAIAARMSPDWRMALRSAPVRRVSTRAAVLKGIRISKMVSTITKTGVRIVSFLNSPMLFERTVAISLKEKSFTSTIPVNVEGIKAVSASVDSTMSSSSSVEVTSSGMLFLPSRLC